MAAVTARFKVSRVTPMGQDPYWAHEVEMTPDYANGKNSEWSAATPSGVLRLTITNPDAVAQFEIGKAVDLTMDIHDE